MNYLELISIVNKHNRLYYDESSPIVSDAEYDSLYDKLVKIEEEQNWKHPDSPTLHVGGSRGKVKHVYKLYSMKKTYDELDIDKTRFNVATPKIDGANLTVIYKNGKRLVGLTRGNGEYGDDVSHLLPYIKGLPETIDIPGTVVITGECVTEDKTASNFRNYVSGALGLKDAEEFKNRKIRYLVHDYLNTELDYVESLLYLEDNGFTTVYNEEAKQYPQDGIVYRINSLEECKLLGYTAKHPRFSIALKTRELLSAETFLNEVTWEIGRTGTVNPVGIIEPVVLGDAKITRVTLHNYGIIRAMNLGLGDRILVERAGNIIPKIVCVIEHSKHNLKITKDDAEKAIGYEVVEVGTKLYVKDKENTPNDKLLLHFIRTLGIKGLGVQSIKKLDLQYPSELYTFNDWNLLGVNGDKIRTELEISKSKPYSIVLASFGIEGVGKTMAEKIVKYLPRFDMLNEIEHTNIPGVGPATRNKILNWLVINKEWVEKLPLQLIQTEIVDKETYKKVCISGKLDMTKQQLGTILEKFNIQVVNNVAKDTYALIYDKEGSTKYKKAIDYGVMVIEYKTNKKKILTGAI